MRIVSDSLTLAELRHMAEGLFGNLVKAIVDVDKGVLALDAELHADLEALLIENGSKQKDLRGSICILMNRKRVLLSSIR